MKKLICVSRIKKLYLRAMNCNELGIEISFPINTFDKTFEIDIQLLKNNKEKYIFEWDPINALK